MEDAKVRLRSPQRLGQQVVFVVTEDALPPEHPARLFWTAFGTCDLSVFVLDAKAVEGRQGRDRLDPRMLLTLWAFALWEGVVHAREIERRIDRDLAYRWIVGDLTVSRSKLSEFLATNRDAFVEVLCDILAALLAEGLIFLPHHRLAEDGTKVEANASTRSFRTRPRLEQCREQAALHLRAVLARADEPPAEPRSQSAQEYHAKAILERVERATKAAEQVARERKERRASEDSQSKARGSTTDPEARIMKFADGAFQPGHNVQLGVVGSGRGGPLAIVGVQVTGQGNDKGSLWSMRQRIAAWTGVTPTEVIVDSDHLTLDDLRRAAQEGYGLYSTVPSSWNPDSRYQDATTQAWIEQMNTPEAKEIYRERKAISERPNAFFKQRFGLRQVPVRGAEKVEALFLLAALVFNVCEHRKLWIN